MSYPVFHVPAGDVLPVMFSSYAGSTGASATLTGLAVTDIEIYKDGSTTQRASDAGYTLLDTDGIDFDGITGIHGFSIDTGDNTDASFYTVGAWFTVVVSAVTVDSQTVNFIACQFRIMATESVAGTPAVDVTAISSDATAANNAEAFFDGTGYAGTNNVIPTVTTATNVTTVNGLAANVITAASMASDAGAEIADAVWDEAIAGHAAAGSTGEALSSAGSAGDPWATALPGAYGAGTAGRIIGRIPDIAAGSAGGLFIAGSNAATTVAITGNITGNLSGSVGSVTGAVGSVTGNVGGNVAGSVGSLTTNNDKTGYTLSATGSAAMTEGYAALGAAGTLPQILYEIRALLAEKSISSTTLTTKKLDGSTQAATYTLDDATTPNAITRAS